MCLHRHVILWPLPLLMTGYIWSIEIWRLWWAGYVTWIARQEMYPEFCFKTTLNGNIHFNDGYLGEGGVSMWSGLSWLWILSCGGIWYYRPSGFTAGEFILWLSNKMNKWSRRSCYVTKFQTLRKVLEIGLRAVGYLHFANSALHINCIKQRSRNCGGRSGEERPKQILRQLAIAFTS